MSYHMEAYGYHFTAYLAEGERETPEGVIYRAACALESQLKDLPEHRVASLWAFKYAAVTEDKLVNSRHPDHLQCERIANKALRSTAHHYGHRLCGHECFDFTADIPY